MGYMQKLVGEGRVAVGLSADWVNLAYRIDGNEDVGAVVFDGENGELEHITYTHNEDGERTDTVLCRCPDVTPALFGAYAQQAGLADAASGGHDPVGCLEIAARMCGLEIWVGDAEHAGWLVADVAGWCETLLRSGGHGTERQFTYATDSGSGVVKAASLADAYQTMRAKISDAQIDDGATLWVEDEETGERITMPR